MTALAALAACGFIACGDRTVEDTACELPSAERTIYYPQSSLHDLDVLIVLDTSPATAPTLWWWSTKAISPWMKLVDALRVPKLNNKLPDVHIGLISADLGAGTYTGIPGCKPGGEGGKLQSKPSVSGCVMPKDPWISHIGGLTNIDNPAIKDPIKQVKQALHCIDALQANTKGCPFSQPLEAARRALDPKLNVNKGFLRKDALLYLLFITAADDCSATKPQLFDPSQTTLTDPLGPLSTFRCFEFGVTCDCAGGPCTRTTTGARKNCHPAAGWMYKVEDYVSFFKALKPPGRVMASVVSGPTDRVEVKLENGLPVLMPGCQSTVGTGAPAIRLEAFVRALNATGMKGYFNQGTDHTATQNVPINVCSPEFGPAARMLQRLVVADLGSQCLTAPPLTEDCGLACSKGVATGAGAPCTRSCLHRADCTLKLGSIYNDTGQPAQKVQRCPKTLFDDPSTKVCSGAACPCWRLVPRTMCSAAIDGSPYALELLRAGPATKGEVATLTCAVSTAAWGSASALTLPECEPADEEGTP